MPREVIALLAAIVVALAAEDRPCTINGDHLTCKLRTIAGARQLLKEIPASQQISSLHLICSDVLFFESHLDPEDFLLGADELIVDYCKIRRVPAAVFSRMGALRNLTLRTHNGDWSAMVMELERDSFHGLGELRHLDFSDNNIWSLPRGVFCPLFSLKKLNLTGNRLQEITQLSLYDWLKTGKFCNTDLEVLDVSNNDIAAVPDESLSALRSLNSLYLQDNSISTILDRSLHGLVSLQILNLTSNFIVSLPPDLFQSSRDIKQIHIKNNSLNILAPGLFDKLDQLQVLDLSHNELTSRSVNRDTFSGLVRMVVLNLAHNQLTRIDATLFHDLYNLQVLNVEHNRIDFIADGAFRELKNLYALTLSHNDLKSIEAHHFSGLHVLAQLFLDHNRISFAHRRAFENTTNLQHLGIGGNDLQTVPKAIRNLRLLKSLDLGQNNISAVNNSSFEGLDLLYGLRLVDNAISEITIESFINLPSLQVLNLASNKIKRIEWGAFSPNANLKVVRLDDNELSDITGIFGDLKELGWLNVSDNKIVRFDYNDLPANLEWLDLHSNMILKLPQYVSFNTVKLKMLDASFNLLRELNSGLIPSTIENLYLNNNNISAIASGTFVNKPNLQKVVLYGNEIRTLDMNALTLTPVAEGGEVAQFYIGGNPFKCDCTMEWLQRINEFVQTRQYPRVMDLDMVDCILTHARGSMIRPVLEMKPSQFLCPYDFHCFALCHCCDFDACDCEMTCPTNCTCFHDMTWGANVVDCSNAGYEEVPAKIPMDATEIHLDGNNLRDLGSHVFIGKKKLQVLYLNNSNLQNVHNRTFKGVESLKVLHLENNKIQELRGDEFDQLHNLNELYLDHNSISHVGNNTFMAMKNLEVLRLDENKIVNFSPWQLLASSSGLAHVSLEGNKWSCECRYIVKLDTWLRSNPGDPEKMFCSYPDRKETVAAMLSRCSNYMDNRLTTSYERGEVFFSPTFIGQNYISIFAGIFIAIVIVCMLGALLFAFRQDVRLWVHSKYGVRLFKDHTASNVAEPDTDRVYDAYIVYSIRDEDFITRIIASELEQNGYSICLHYRDIHMMTGNSYLADSIASTADASKRIIVVLTLNFLTLEWMNHDMKTSILSSLKSIRLASKNNKIIFILTTDVSAINLDAELQLHLRSHGAFYFGERRFWEKLRFAMPDVVQDKKAIPETRGSPNPRYTTPPVLDQRYLHQTMPNPAKAAAEQPECSRDYSHSVQRGRTYFV